LKANFIDKETIEGNVTAAAKRQKQNFLIGIWKQERD
jgi:hypothetical protein